MEDMYVYLRSIFVTNFRNVTLIVNLFPLNRKLEKIFVYIVTLHSAKTITLKFLHVSAVSITVYRFRMLKKR